MPGGSETPLIDEYRLNWCLRYLREAMVDYEYLRLVESVGATLNLCSTAVRKAQTAVLYALGEPTYVYDSVVAVMKGVVEADDPLIRALVSMERFVRSLINLAPSIQREALLRVVGSYLSIAERLVKEILKSYTGEDLNRSSLTVDLGMRKLTCTD